MLMVLNENLWSHGKIHRLRTASVGKILFFLKVQARLGIIACIIYEFGFLAVVCLII